MAFAKRMTDEGAEGRHSVRKCRPWAALLLIAIGSEPAGPLPGRQIPDILRSGVPGEEGTVRPTEAAQKWV